MSFPVSAAEASAHRLWTLFEPIHGIVYFAPEPAEEYRRVGLRGRWMGYFASRSAAMGRVGPETVIATFFTFGPAVVRRAIPDAWGFASPERVVEARWSGVDAALRRLWGERVESREVRLAADLALQAALDGDPSGRPIYAAQRALPIPEEPHLALWHACTLLREHRFEGHRAGLIVAGLDGCEAQVSAAIAGDLDPGFVKGFRGWSDAEWEAAKVRLRQRGLVEGEAALTAKGSALRDEVEAVTDRLAASPWRQLGASRCEEVAGLLLPLARALHREGGVPELHPMGIPQPS
jgi:hypothetical protein